MSAAQMEEQIRIDHPNRYDIPNVHNIWAYVTKCLKAMKAAGNGTSVQGPQKAPHYSMPVAYAEVLETLIRKDPLMKHADGEQKLLTVMKFTSATKPPDFPPVDKLKAKLSSIKQRLRKEHKA